MYNEHNIEYSNVSELIFAIVRCFGWHFEIIRKLNGPTTMTTMTTERVHYVIDL